MSYAAIGISLIVVSKLLEVWLRDMEAEKPAIDEEHCRRYENLQRVAHQLDLENLIDVQIVFRAEGPSDEPPTTQEQFWRKQVESRPLADRLAHICTHFAGSHGCGWEEGIFYPLPAEDGRILRQLWRETYLEIFGHLPTDGEGP